MKKFFGKAAVLFGVFFLIIGIYGYTVYKDNVRINQKELSKLMGDASLPVVQNVADGFTFNEIHGYTMDMDISYMRDNVIPVLEDDIVEFDINPYDCTIIGIDYEIVDYKNREVVAHDKIAKWDKKGNVLKARLKAPILNPDEEYSLKLVITTEDQTKIQYYAVLQKQDNDNIEKVLTFVKEFSKSTLSYEKAADFAVPYLEPDPNNPNTNLGKVDITSSLRQLTYQGLDVSRVTEPVITIWDTTKEAVCVKLQYRVKAKNEYETEEQYNITENYRVAIHNGTTYLVAYDRSMDQIYQPETGNTNTKRLNLGIDSDLSVEYQTSESNNYISFVDNHSLYMMDIQNNEVSEAFSFEEKDTDGVRENYDKHGIKLIKTYDSGDIDFLVYGYMNRGEHEGKSGVTLYRYNKSKNIVEERIYIPSAKPYEVLKEVVGKLCYISNRGMMYIYLDNSIYSVDLEGKQYVEVVGDLKEQDYAISSDGKNLAWLEKSEDGGNIRILNLENGEEKSVKGEKGKRLVPLGFIGDDLVSGTASEKNVYLDRYGDETILMSNLKIISHEDGKTLKNYSKKGSYIVDVKVSDAMIDFALCRKADKSENSVGYKVTGHDQILNNIETKQAAVTTGTIVTDLKQTQLVIHYAGNVISKEETKLIYLDEIRSDAKNGLSIKNDDKEDNNYYIYAQGQIDSISSSQAKAKDIAKEKKGLVTDGKGNRVYGYEEKWRQ